MYTCSQCGKKVNRKQTKICRACIGYHVWTKAEDNFIRQYYPQRGSSWCAKKLGLTPYKIRRRASELKVLLTPKAYKRIVHDAATKANTGIARTPEFAEASRKRALERLDFFKAQLVKGRLANQKNKPSGLERKLWSILQDLSIHFEKQVVIKKSLIVDVRIGNIIIEADGDWWHGHPRFEPLTPQQQKQQRRDRAKDKYLKSCGYTVLRIWESDMSLATVQNALVDAGALVQPTLLSQLVLPLD